MERNLSPRFAVACSILLSVLLAGCATVPPPPPPPPPAPRVAAPRDTVVLLPDAAGRTGVVVVTGAGAERRLSRPNEAVRVDADRSAGEPFLMDPAEVRKLAGAAMDALPEPPARFLLYFTKGNAVLTKDSEATLDEAVKAIKARGAVDVSVVGHSDTQGDKSYNDRLSLERAKAVASRLAAAGVSPGILDIASHGKDNPLVPTGDQVAEPRNRRVEITVR
jgi:outer membrane protein OmpA-like peptidoglycan-associated protein